MDDAYVDIREGSGMTWRGLLTAFFAAAHLAILLRLLFGRKPLDRDGPPPWKALALSFGLIATFFAQWWWNPVWIGLPAAVLALGVGVRTIGGRRDIVIDGVVYSGWRAIGKGVLFLAFGGGMLLFYALVLWGPKPLL